MGAQLSLKAALPLVGILATASDRCSKTGPWQGPVLLTFLRHVAIISANGIAAFFWPRCVNYQLQHIEAETKWPLFSRRGFQMHFREWKCISIKISLKFGPKGLINSIPALVQMMVWRRPDDKPLSWPMVVSLLTHICVTRLNEFTAGNIVLQVVHDTRTYSNVNIWQCK